MVSLRSWQQSSQTLALAFWSSKFPRLRALNALKGPNGQPLPLKEPLSAVLVLFPGSSCSDAYWVPLL